MRELYHFSRVLKRPPGTLAARAISFCYSAFLMKDMTRKRLLWTLAGFAVAAGPEAAFWLGARAAVAQPPAGRCGLLVLGYPSNSDGTLSPEQRDRVKTAVAIVHDFDCERVVISGAPVRNEHSEAATMALAAVRLGMPRERIRLEERARSTLENARFSAPKLSGLDTIFVVSNGLHAHRGVRALCSEAPKLCSKARPAARYYPLRRFFLKFPAALYEGLACLKG